MKQYPNEADLEAVRIGQAAAPMGKPRKAADVPWPLNPSPTSVLTPAVDNPQ